MENAIAQTRLTAILPNGGAQPVNVAVGRPEQRDGVYFCPVEITGLYPDLPAIKGVDSLHALSLAMDFLRLSLQYQLAQGVRFSDGSTGRPVDPMMWFPYLGPPEKDGAVLEDL